MSTLRFKPAHKTVQDFTSMFLHRQLNLEPSFQRKSVWRLSDRKKLIESILHGYPIPSIFLYKQINARGEHEFAVIDGKQRLETILMFVGKFRGERFAIKTRLDSSENEEIWDWRRIQQRREAHRIMSYEIQTIEIEGAFQDIVNLFVRLNSTGKTLTSAEKRHAGCFDNEFMQEAGKLVRRYRTFFQDNDIISGGQIERMKDVEVICELLASIHAGGPINKKKELDKIIAGETVKGRTLQKCVRECANTFNLVKRMFPNIRTTRFKKVSDFYSLYMLLWEMNKNNYVLTDSKRNQQAQKLLLRLSNGVDQLKDQVRNYEGVRPDQHLFRDYHSTVKEGTDSYTNRKRRADILRQILGGLFEAKDDRRNFTPEQRRLIWHSDDKKKCKGKIKGKECGELLTWNNFTIDHIKAHVHGGKTTISNASLMCRTCNSRKGAR